VERGRYPLREVAGVFLKLGLIGFGGPAAHVALMRREIVERRRWVGEQRFLDLFAASNLIPGPTSTELAIFLGYEAAGWPALILAGALFILPAMVIVLSLAWAYVRFGSLPQTSWILYGVTPVVIGIVLDAIWRLGRDAITGLAWLMLAAAAFALVLLQVNVLAVLLGAGTVAAVVVNRGRLRSAGPRAASALLGARALPRISLATAVTGSSAHLLGLVLTFLKLGAVLYGSGYVLLAFLRADFVTHLHWLSDRQLVDAISVGQVTPGPVFTTATFVGYVVAGFPGAVLATVAIFLPSFVLVAAVRPVLPRLRRSPWAAAFLSGATAASLGLMAAVTVQLGNAVIVDVFTALLALASLIVLRRFRVNAAWLILAGGAVGIVAKLGTG
jgi:chromate transporter